MLKCYDHKTREMVAVKIIRNKKRFHKQAIEEVKEREKMKSTSPEGTRHIVRMEEYFLFRRHLVLMEVTFISALPLSC